MEDEILEPVSPTGQYFTSSVISVSIIAVLELEFPIDQSRLDTLLQTLFLPINPRFSSLMVKDKNGKKYWKKVEVDIQEHIKIPNFPRGKSPEFYEDCLSRYLSKISLEQFLESRALWEFHIINYPTKNAAQNLVFKLHHSLGDGYSLMGALLSCLQRADNPQLPLTFPLLNQKIQTNDNKNNILSRAFDSVYDFGWSVLKSIVLEDDQTAIRSGDDGVEFRPITITTMVFSFDMIKKVKASLHVTINDVICGALFLGIRLYIKSTEHEHDQSNAKTTALVLLNTRNINGYKSISEMVKPDGESLWGNQFAFLHVPVPKLAISDPIDPLSFVLDAQKVIKKKRNSAAVILTSKLLETLRKLRGPESLTVTILSYMGQLRIALGTENDLIDAPKFRQCVQDAFDMIFNAAIPFPFI
ncbi:hypothetical protein ABFX02_13G028800 [Erythranthe guttata]